MNLDATTKSLEIILGEAKTTTDCDITASYADNTQNSFLLGENDALSNGTTAVTVVAAPAAFDTQRQVKEVRLHNNDTVQHQVTLRLNNNATIRIIETASVAPGGDFLYTPEAPVTISSGAPAVLLESGTGGEKISAMSAIAIPPAALGTMVPLVVPGDPTNYQSPLQTLLTGAAGTALLQGDTFIITTGADGPTGAHGAGGLELTTGPDVSGGGAGSIAITTGSDVVGGGPGGVVVTLGQSVTTGIQGGSFLLTTGGAGVGDANGGDFRLVIGVGAGTGRSGLLFLFGLPTVDASQTASVWVSNGRLVQSGAIIAPVASTVTSGAAVALTTGTAKDVTTISVPVGNWTISGAVYFTGNAATTVTLVQGSVGTTADTLDTTPGQLDTEYLAAATIATLAADPALPGLSADVTLGSPTTYRLDAKATFAINTLSAYGTIRAVPRA